MGNSKSKVDQKVVQAASEVVKIEKSMKTEKPVQSEKNDEQDFSRGVSVLNSMDRNQSSIGEPKLRKRSLDYTMQLSSAEKAKKSTAKLSRLLEKKHQNSYDLFITMVNNFINEHYSKDTRLVQGLPTADPESELFTDTIPINSNESQEDWNLEHTCVSYDMRLAAFWGKNMINVFDICTQTWKRSIPVEFGPCYGKNQVLFLNYKDQLMVILQDEIHIISVVTGEVVRKLSAKGYVLKNGDTLEIDHIRTYFFVTDSNEKIFETHHFWNRTPTSMILFDGYNFYLVDLLTRPAVPLVEETLVVIQAEGVEQMRDYQFIVPYSPLDYLTIEYNDCDDNTTSTIFKFWELCTEINTGTRTRLTNYLPSQSKQSSLSNQKLVVKLKKTHEEKNIRITKLDTFPLSEGKTKLWVFDTTSKTHFWFDFSAGQTKFEKIYEYLKLDPNGSEPDHIQSIGEDKYILLVEPGNILRLWGLTDDGYKTIFKKQFENRIHAQVPYGTGFILIRDQKSLFIYRMDLPAVHRLEILPIVSQAAVRITHTSERVLVFQSGVLLTVTDNHLFIKKNKSSSFTYHNIMDDIIKQSKGQIKSLKQNIQFRKVIGTDLCVFSSWVIDGSYEYRMRSAIILVMDMITLEIKTFKFVSPISDSKSLPYPIICIDYLGTSVSVCFDNTIYLINTLTGEQIEQPVPNRGRAVLISKDDFIYWDADDPEIRGHSEQTTVIIGFKKQPDGSYFKHSIELGDTNEIYSMHKLSKHKKYLVMYSRKEFVLLNTESFVVSMIDPMEVPMNLYPDMISFSDLETLMGVVTESKKVLLIDTSDINKKTVLGSFDTSSDSLCFFFVGNLNTVGVQDTFLNTITIFSVSPNPGGNPNAIQTGKVQMPKKQRIVGAHVAAASVVFILSSENSKNHLYRLKRPLNNVDFLNTKLMREELKKYYKTDDPTLRKAIFTNMLSIVSMNDRQALTHHPIYCIIFFHLNHPEALTAFAKVVGSIDILFTNHPLLKLFFLVNGKRESMINTVRLFEDYFQEFKKYPAIDQETMTNLIQQYDKSLISNNLREDLFLKILFAPYPDKYSGELKSDTTAIVRFEADRRDDGLKSDVVRIAVESLLRKDPKNLSDFSIFESLIPINFGTGSRFGTALFETFDNVSNDSLKSRCKVLIYQKWNKIFPYAMMYAIIFWTMSIILYAALSIRTESKGLGTTVIVLNSLFLIYEFKNCISNFSRYIRDPWNYYDIFIQVLSIVANGLVAGKEETQMTIALNWVRVIVVLLVGIRAITWLRVFSPTRYLITMVLGVFQDFVPFLIILITAIFVFAFFWRLTPGLGPSEVVSPHHFYTAIQVPVNIIFGNAPQGEPDGEPFNMIKFIIIIFGNTTLALVLMNFLIALIGGTFSRISDNKDLYDVRELLYIIRDLDGFLTGFRRPFDRCFPNRTKGYYLSLIPDDEVSDQFAQLKSGVSDLLDYHSTSIKQTVLGAQEYIKAEGQRTREDARRESFMVRSLIENFRGYLETVEAGNRKSLEEVLNRVNQLEKALLK